MLDSLAPGDVVTVTRLDRLARSTFDLFGIVKQIVDAEAQFRSPAEPWADTGTSTGRLMLASRRTGRRRARSYPHPHRRRPEPRQGPRKAHGPPPFPDTGPTERSHQTARVGRYARRTRPQLQCKPRYDFTADSSMTSTEFFHKRPTASLSFTLLTIWKSWLCSHCSCAPILAA